MSKVTKKELRQLCIDNKTAIARLESILKENGIERQPQLKKLDQSVFNGLDSEWKYAAVDGCGEAYTFKDKPEVDERAVCFIDGAISECNLIGEGYDATNWKNSLIERESVELTGSELCKEMLARGDTHIMCIVRDKGTRQYLTHVIRAYSDGKFHTKANRWTYAIPIDNQGKPLTAAEAGF